MSAVERTKSTIISAVVSTICTANTAANDQAHSTDLAAFLGANQPDFPTNGQSDKNSHEMRHERSVLCRLDPYFLLKLLLLRGYRDINQDQLYFELRILLLHIAH